MNHRLRNLFLYFENVFHPASGRSEQYKKKNKRSGKKTNHDLASPESFALRGGIVKKQDKVRRNPAP